jgi:peroxiredoxin
MVTFGRTSMADRSQTLQVGDMAPDFELPGHRVVNGTKEKIRLSDFRGKKNVVLVFYPLDWTPV